MFSFTDFDRHWHSKLTKYPLTALVGSVYRAFPPILSIGGWLPRTGPPGDFKTWTDVDFVDQALARRNRPLADVQRFTAEASIV